MDAELPVLDSELVPSVFRGARGGLAMQTDDAYLPGAYSSYRQILVITLPAILLNAAIPFTTTIQTALLGNLPGHSRSQLAAFAAVAPFIGFPVSLFNFLVRTFGIASRASLSLQQQGLRAREGAPVVTRAKCCVRGPHTEAWGVCLPNPTEHIGHADHWKAH